MANVVSLSDAKAHLSEVVRTVRATGQPVTITVDGQPAAQVGPVPAEFRPLTEAEVAVDEVVAAAILRLMTGAPSFDAVELVREGRR